MRNLKAMIEQRTPKQKMVVVTGTYQSGKTQFMSSFSGKAPEEMDVWDLTHAEWFDKDGNCHTDDTVPAAVIPLPDEGTLVLLEWRGARRWDGLFDDTGDFIQGCMIVLDSTRPETFREVKSIVETFRAFPPELLPPVIAVNRPHDPGAWTLDDLRIALRLEAVAEYLKLDKPIPLLACDAANQRDTMKAVAALAEHMLDKNFAALLKKHLAE